MKKILLILLAFSSFASFAQAEFPEGIALSGNAPSASTSKIVTQDPTTGNLDYINAVSLPLSTEANLELIKKQFLSTGLLQNGLISSSPDDTKFNITAGIGVISNFDDPENPISTLINFPAFNFITPAYLNTGNITYVAINSTPAVVMQATPFTPEQRRSLILLGAVIHSNLTTINVLNNISAPSNADTNQLHDFMEAVGALNLTGNKYTENGANLQLNKSAGVLFKLGSNFAVEWRNPHQIAQAGGTAITFRYRTQNGTESADMTSISPGLYDLNNVLTTVPNNKFTIQTVTIFQTGLTRIQWGQSLYDDLQSAKNALLTRDFVVENNIKENGVTRAYIIVRNTTTSLQNVADAYISEAQKFGGVASGGVALTLANIVTALGYTPENVANKTGTLTASSVLYPNNAAVIAGLALKQNVLTNPITGTGTSNTIPKFTGTTTQGNSNITDNGTLVSTSTDMTVNGVRIGRGGGNLSSNTGIGASALVSATSGFSTTAVGESSLQYSLGSTSTTALGRASGAFASNGTTQITNAYNSVFLGSLTKPLGDNQTNQIVIGNIAVGLGSNTTVIGNSSTLSSRIWGRFLSGKSSDDGINQGQYEGTVSAFPATLSNQVVVKSQLDLKADLVSTVLTTGDQSSTGTKTITNNNTTIGRLLINNSRTVAGSFGESFGINVNNLGDRGINVESTNGIGIRSFSNNGDAYISTKSESGTGLRMSTLNPTTDTGDFISVQIGIIDAFKIRNNGTIKMMEYTVATLPTPTGTAYATVTDALAPTYLGTLIGGGTVKTPVFYDGTVWRSIVDATDVVRNIAKDATQGANVTGTVSETILYSKLIPANTFKDGDFMNIVLSRIGKTGTAGTLNQRIRINTSNTLSLSTIIATNFLVSTGLMGNMSRIFNVSNGNIVSVLNNGAFTSDIVNTNTEPKSTLFNPAIDNYIFVTGQLSNSADTMYHLGTKITN